MKKLLLATVAVVFVLASCQAPAAKTDGKATKSEISYAVGVLLGTNIKGAGLDFDFDALSNGMKDVVLKDKTTVTLEEANTIVQAAVVEAAKVKADANAVKEKAFLESNGKKTGVKTTASGLQYEVVKEGTGAKPLETDTVKVDYEGTLSDGTKFDSSIDRGEPAVFPLDGVIPGWTEGIQLMSVGSQYKFYIPSALAYGEEGTQDGKIPGNSTLVFTVTLISIEKI